MIGVHGARGTHACQATFREGFFSFQAILRKSAERAITFLSVAARGDACDSRIRCCNRSVAAISLSLWPGKASAMITPLHRARVCVCVCVCVCSLHTT